MKPFGKTLLAGLVAGIVAALIGYAVGAALVKGEDVERTALSLTLVLAFLAGTLTCGITAPRFDTASPYLTAVLAALAFEAILLVVARPGLSFRAIVIAFAATTFLALIGAFAGRMMRRKS
jgi:Na+/melibiose symporter-like transporter